LPVNKGKDEQSNLKKVDPPEEKQKPKQPVTEIKPQQVVKDAKQIIPIL
jgi:hypothetical protein